MTYATVLENMQKADRALRVCLGTANYKKLKKLESKAIELQKMIMDLRTFIQANQECTSVKQLKESGADFIDGPLAKYLKNDNDNLWTALMPVQRDCQGVFGEIRALIKRKAGAHDLYTRMLNTKTEFTRLHFNMDAPSLEEKLMSDKLYISTMRSLVGKIDELMAESIYRNQQGITYAEYERNTRELYSLDLISKNYTAENAKLMPECEILKPTEMWKYVGVGLEPIEIRIEELTELQNRFLSVPGVNALLVEIQQLKKQHTDKLDGVFVEQANGDMVAEETFGDEYDTQPSERGVTPAVTIIDEAGTVPRGLTQNMIHVDDAGFLPKGDVPEVLSVAGLNGYSGHSDACRDRMFAKNLTDEEMKEKLLAQTPVGEDKDYLGAWTTGDKNPTTLTETCRRATAQSLIDDKAYARGRS